MTQLTAIPGGSHPIVSLTEVTKTYTLGKVQVPALRGVTLEVYPGEFISIAGPSGSG
ncbi:MAG: ABC transporter ATP-binding protein, partial [Archangium sp.]